MKYLKRFILFENNSPLLNLKNNVDVELVNIIKSLISSGKILEISCGNGADAITLSNLGYDVVTTELCTDYKNWVNSQGIECILHDTKEKFPFNDSSFDLVYSRLGLHYFSIEELELIFDELTRLTKKYLVFTVKLVNDIPTGKVILDENKWKEITEKNFNIISHTVKTGILYDNQSKWLEIVATKL